jgi:glycine betaine/proline transport system substrate-binding protein
MKSRSKYFFLNLVVLIIFLFCNPGIRAQDEDEDEGGEEETPKGFITLVYVEWASEVASTFVMKAILEEMGHEVDTLSVSAAFMWQAIASGDADGMVAAWLPSTHEHYYNAVKDEIDDLGPNLKGTRIGLVVPRYVTINSIAELNAAADQFGRRIIGIDPGAGLMSKTELAIKEYNLSAFKLIEGSGATMAGALADALREKKWLVVTGWTPHWKFARWELKYLEDPKNVYGQEEQIHTIVRQGLKEDLPDVYKVMDNFFWTAAEMEKVMIWNSEPNASPEENAKRWVKENHDKVEQWKK